MGSSSSWRGTSGKWNQVNLSISCRIASHNCQLFASPNKLTRSNEYRLGMVWEMISIRLFLEKIITWMGLISAGISRISPPLWFHYNDSHIIGFVNGTIGRKEMAQHHAKLGRSTID